MNVSITCTDPAIKATIRDHVSRLMLWAPKDHMHITVYESIMDDKEYGTDNGPTDGCMGCTSGLKQDHMALYLDQIEKVRSKAVELPSPTWFMPVSEHIDALIYVLTHEWGHGVDPAPWSMLDTPMAQMFLDTTREYWINDAGCPTHFSDYGMTGYREGWAEAFVEWHMSYGHTESDVARWFANRYGWYSFK